MRISLYPSYIISQEKKTRENNYVIVGVYVIFWIIPTIKFIIIYREILVFMQFTLISSNSLILFRFSPTQTSNAYPLTRNNEIDAYVKADLYLCSFNDSINFERYKKNGRWDTCSLYVMNTWSKKPMYLIWFYLFRKKPNRSN